MPRQPWWQKGIIYQIYPRSFLDTTNNGIGDLPGIIRKMDYLESLGITAIWLCPIFPSPMYDFGYDTSDYYQIEPLFGSMENLDNLLSIARGKKIRLILDLALNHTSHLHPWFMESSASRNNPKADWYIWSDPLNGKRPPNNWKSVFGGGAWSWSEKRKQFFLHSFTPQQPDLNWRNPEVKKELFKVISFWLEKGIDGFRLDVVDFYLKDQKLRSNPYRLGKRPYEMQKHIYDKNRPESIEIMQEIRSLLDGYSEKMALGEVAERNTRIAASYYGPENEGLHLNFNFKFLEQPWKAGAFREAIAEWEGLLGKNNWPVYTLSNHDVPRHFSRFGNCKERAKVAATLLLTLRGTPVLYYGEEIGMAQGKIPRSKILDPVGKRYWPFHPGRDGSRTPMQWNDEPHAGFSKTKPWLPVNPNFKQVNHIYQKYEPSSLYNFYRNLIEFRNKSDTLQRGELRLANLENKNILGYKRQTSRETLLIFLNFSGKNQETQISSVLSPSQLVFRCPDQAIEIKNNLLILPPNGLAIFRE